MVNFKLVGMQCEEIRIKMNSIKAEPDTKFEIKPQFNRNVKLIKELPLRRIVEFIVRIESTSLEPKPFDLLVRLVAAFDLDEEIWLVEEEKEFASAASRIMYPYLRSVAANLTSSAMLPPLQLPIIDGGVMFPEDK